MFSWTDYFNDKVEIVNDKSDIKILKKSNLCEKMNESIYSRNNCDDKCNMFLPKTSNTKSHNCRKYAENVKMKCSNTKSSSKILDLSPEEKEKIAALIRELGVLQSEKEKVSNEMNVERNKFQLELKSLERMYESTLADKDRLEEELRQKDEAFKRLELEELKKTRDNRKLTDSNAEFIIIPKSSLKDFDQSSIASKASERYFLGPPKSSRSQIITSDMLRSRSQQSIEQPRDSTHLQLIEEQKELLVEKHYLNLVLRQQKCLEKLTNKIAKLEHSQRRSKKRREVSVDHSERSSVVTSQRDLVTPITLNNGSLDDDSLSQSISVSTLSESPIVRPSNSPTDLQQHNSDRGNDPMILKNDDVLLISALNHGIKDLAQNIHALSRPQSGLSSLRTQSPPDSLFHIIDSFEDFPLPNYTSDIDNQRPSLQICPEDDILNDLFFNI